MSSTKYYDDNTLYIKQLLRALAADESPYDWRQAYYDIQKIGWDNFLKLLNAIYNLDDENYRGGFLAAPAIDEYHKLIYDTPILTPDKNYALIEKGTELSLGYDVYFNGIETRAIHIDGGFTKYIPYANIRKVITLEGHEQGYTGTGGLLLAYYYGDIPIYTIIPHRLNIVAESEEYENILNNAISIATTENQELLSIYSGLNHTIDYANTGFLHTPSLDYSISLTWEQINLTFNSVAYYNANYNSHSYIYIADGTYFLHLSSEVIAGQGALEYGVARLYINTFPAENSPYGKKLMNEYLGIEIPPNPNSDLVENKLDIFTRFVNRPNTLGYILRDGNNNVYFVPQFMDPPNIRKTVLWMPPYHSAPTNYPPWPIRYKDGLWSIEKIAINDIGPDYTPLYINVYGVQRYSSAEYGDESSTVSYADAIVSDINGNTDMFNYDGTHVYIGLGELPGYSTTDVVYSQGAHGGVPQDMYGNIFSRKIQPIFLHQNEDGTWYIDYNALYDAMYCHAKNITNGHDHYGLRWEGDKGFPFFAYIIWSRAGLFDAKWR